MLQVRDRRVVQLPSDIPKIIHQSWKTADMPETFRHWSQSWKECLPDWEFKLHTDEDNRQIFVDNFPEILHTFDGYPQGIMRADASRLAYMATDGGLYADLDIECLKDPYAVIAQGDSIVLACEGCEMISNAFMMGGESAKSFYKELLLKLPEEAQGNGPLAAPGPVYVTKKAEPLLNGPWKTEKGSLQHISYQHGDVIVPGVVLDDAWVFGVPWYSDEATKTAALDRNWVIEQFPNSIAFSHWSATWQGKPLPTIVSLAQVEANGDRCECMLGMLSRKDIPSSPCQAYVQNRMLAWKACQGRICFKNLMHEYLDSCI